MKKIIPQCKYNRIPYFNVEGRWNPCCNIHAEKNIDFLNDDDFLISNNKDLNSFHLNKKFTEWLSIIENDYSSAPWICKKICGVDDSKNKTLHVEQNFIFNYFDLFNFLENKNVK